MQGRSFQNNEIVQEITDSSRVFRVIGTDKTVLLQSKERPNRQSSQQQNNFNSSNNDASILFASGESSNLYILTGHEDDS